MAPNMVVITIDGFTLLGWYQEFCDSEFRLSSTFEKWLRNNKTFGRKIKMNFLTRNPGNSWLKVTCLDDIDAVKMRLRCLS